MKGTFINLFAILKLFLLWDWRTPMDEQELILRIKWFNIKILVAFGYFHIIITLIITDQRPLRTQVFKHAWRSNYGFILWYFVFLVDLFGPSTGWNPSGSQQLLGSPMNWTTAAPQYDISSYSQFTKFSYDYLQDPTASSISPISSHLVSSTKDEDRSPYFDYSDKMFLPPPNQTGTSSLLSHPGGVPSLGPEIPAPQDTMVQLQNCSRAHLPACVR